MNFSKYGTLATLILSLNFNGNKPDQNNDLYGLNESSKEKKWKDGCDNLKIGVVGASNTVLASYRKDYVEYLREECKDAKIFLYAKGGYGPKEQASLVRKMLTKHADLDLVTLNPSENSIGKLDLKLYTKYALNLAQMVKDKNPRTKVAMLTTTPSKGHSKGTPWAWTPEIEKKKLIFNENLVKDKLGRSDLIDYAVNTYFKLENPRGSMYCGKHCTSDKIHLNSAGQKIVVDVVVGVF